MPLCWPFFFLFLYAVNEKNGLLTMDWILGLHVLSACYMLGLIWFVQVVHYPLMGAVHSDNFVHYENLHTQKTGWVTAPVMLVELVTGAWLCLFAGEASVFWGINLIGIILIWASTFFIQVPLHNQLSLVWSKQNIDRLVRSNWVRTILWTVKATALIGYLLCTLG